MSVKLLGVCHGGHYIDFLGMERGEIFVNPHPSLIAQLKSLPQGSRVGIETLSLEDMPVVVEEFDRVISENNLSGSFPSKSCEFYWSRVERNLKTLNLEPVFLERPKEWFDYANVLVKIANQERLRGEGLFLEEGESKFHYHWKLLKFNEADHALNLERRRIHEIERDNALLEKIAGERLDACVVGFGHAAYWTVNKVRIRSERGIDFDYCPTEDDEKIVKEKLLIEKEAFEREGLERALRLKETGRVVEGRNPDFVGIWDDCEPSRGYFEVFLDGISGTFSGRVEDCLGSASIVGKREDKSVQFVKTYDKNRSCLDAAKGDIDYRALSAGDSYVGGFLLQGSNFASGFYMQPFKGTKPITMSLKWDRILAEVKKSAFDLLNL